MVKNVEQIMITFTHEIKDRFSVKKLKGNLKIFPATDKSTKTSALLRLVPADLSNLGSWVRRGLRMTTSGSGITSSTRPDGGQQCRSPRRWALEVLNEMPKGPGENGKMTQQRPFG